MDRGPGRQPAGPAPLRAAPVQRGNQTVDELEELSSADPLVLRWLEEHDRDDEAERLERLLADQDLVTRLEFSNYADSEWEPVATEFARYGMSVLRSWIGKRTIFGRLREKGLGGLPEVPREWFDDEIVNDLATETTVMALRWFKTNVLMKHRWNPARPGGAASLKTFFVGQILFQFRAVYRRWYRAERDRRQYVAVADPTDELLNAADVERVDQLVVDREEVARALTQVNGEHARKAFVMSASGWTHAEIAAALHLPDEKAVENVLGWQRRRLRRRTEGVA